MATINIKGVGGRVRGAAAVSDAKVVSVAQTLQYGRDELSVRNFSKTSAIDFTVFKLGVNLFLQSSILPKYMSQRR